jgi:monoterpene epsilon-lactone hydrolase
MFEDHTMSELGGNGSFLVPTRVIPIPRHLSPEAQAQLAQEMMSNPPWPELDDLAGWRRMIAAMDEIAIAGLSMMAAHADVDVKAIDADGVRVFVATPRDLPADDRSVYVEFHGGALLWGSGESCRANGAGAGMGDRLSDGSGSSVSDANR